MLSRDASKLRVHWFCVCECGGKLSVDSAALHVGNTTSCGCFRRERSATNGANFSRHKETGTALHRAWLSMRRRCGNDPYYVARGIAVCGEWDSYEAFAAWARATGWREDLTIDRIDNDRGYEPTNCRFATKAEQARNRSSTRFTVDQVRAIRSDLAGWQKGDLSEYARRHGLSPRYVHEIVTLKRWADI